MNAAIAVALPCNQRKGRCTPSGVCPRTAAALSRLEARATRLLAAVWVAGVLAGCGGGDLADLEAFVGGNDSTKAAQSPSTEVAPQHETPVPFAYGAMHGRSPFEPAAAKLDAKGATTGLRPDASRQRQALERFPLGQLQLVGGMRGRGVDYALIQDPLGEVRRVTVGDYLGTDHGRIARIRDDGVDLVEIVRDGAGGWLRRSRTVTLASVAEQASDPRTEEVP